MSDRLFGTGRRPALIGMVHLGPLPGAPRFKRDPLRRALEDARRLADGGCDALLIENFGDVPFYPGAVEPQNVAQMTRIATAVAGTTAIPLGINVLRNDARAALAVAQSAGARFIRVNIHTGVAITDQGRIEGEAHDTLRYRRSIGAEGVRIFADLMVKHSRPARDLPLATAARDAAYRGLADALLLTGMEPGNAPVPATVEDVRHAVPDRPVLVASGITPGNIGTFHADGYIVGTSIKRAGRAENPVDPRRVKRLRDLVDRTDR